MKMSDRQFIAYLTREARLAVLSHREDYAERPEAHRGCLWCEDGRLSYVLEDYRQFYGERTANAVDRLYERAYVGYEGIM